ncbi:MAG TPA: SDR family NAD(P)-dependent oxidoreductase [bacterium]|nr:SDR family NAD(P)-dependent oxidoreductase [bacterium]
MTGELSGKVAIVSGAAQGVSSVILRRLAQDGARAVIVDIDTERAEAGVRDLTARGCDARFIHTDVRDSAQVNAMVDRVVEQCGRVDILVHGAGVGVHKEIVDLSDDEWDLQIDVQLRGAFLLSRAVGRRLIAQKQGGRIILIGSTSGNNARVRGGPHAASKAGEIQLAHVLAMEMGRHGVTVNVVSPGLTNIAGISRSVQTPEYQRAFIAQVPLGRLATPDEIADAVLFFASDRARFVTGQVLCVDGGYSAGKLAVQGPSVDAFYGQVREGR